MADIGAGVAGRVGGGQGGQARLAMHWTPIMSAFVLRCFADLVGERVKTDRGFKEVLLNNVARPRPVLQGSSCSLCTQARPSTHVGHAEAAWRTQAVRRRSFARVATTAR
jgi:hypothetical protein